MAEQSRTSIAILECNGETMEELPAKMEGSEAALKEKSKSIEGKSVSWMAEQSRTSIAILEGNSETMEELPAKWKGQRQLSVH